MAKRLKKYKTPQELRTEIAWWEKGLTAKEAGNRAWEMSNRIYAQQGLRRAVNRRNTQLYVGSQLIGIYSPDFVRDGSLNESEELAYNLCYAVVETAAATVAGSNRRVTTMTNGGDWKMRRKGKLLAKYIDGMFHRCDVHTKMKREFRNACVKDTGFVKVVRRDKELHVDRCHTDDVAADNFDALYGEPQVTFDRKAVQREGLLERLGVTATAKMKKAVAEARLAGTAAIHGMPLTSDLIEVREGYKLDSYPGAGDGKRIIFIEDCALDISPWPHPWHPFVPIRYGQRPAGWIGKALIDHVVGGQFEINGLLEMVQEAFAKNVPRIAIEVGSNINFADFTDIPFSFIEFQNRPPEPLIWPAVDPAVLQQIEVIWEKMFQIAGLSQTIGTGRKQPGIESAAALREFEDIQSERLILVSQDYEAAHVDVATRLIEMARDVAKDNGGKFPVNVPLGKGRFQQIDWSEVDMARDAFMLQPHPTAFLPQTRAGRLQFVQDMMNMGLLGRDEALALLDYPDLEHAISMITAALENIDFVIDQALDEDVYLAPSQFDNLDIAGRRVAQAIQKAAIDGYPDKHIDNLRRYLGEVEQLTAQVTARKQIEIQHAMMVQQQQQAQQVAPNPSPQELTSVG